MKIITATGIPEINERLKKETNFEVIGKDIQYQEGILEILEEKRDIEGVILSNNLIIEMEFNLLISRILEINKDIEIVVFLKEKDDKIEIFLNSNEIYKIYYLDNYEMFFLGLKNKEMSNKDIKKNIEDFKKIIYQERTIDRSEKEPINKEKIKENFYINNIISFSGSYGVGKSITSILFSKYMSEKYKVLLIDCDFINKSINTILGISKHPKNYDKDHILSAITKYHNNFYILSSLDNFINNYEFIEYSFFISCLEKLKNEFDFIIIDTSSDLTSKINNFIYSYSSKIVFLIEPNLSEVKKANTYLEKIIKDYEIQEEKINIIFNKANKYKINERVLNEIYSEKRIIGEIDYSEKYNLIINKNIFKDNDDYEKIFQKVIEGV